MKVNAVIHKNIVEENKRLRDRVQELENKIFDRKRHENHYFNLVNRFRLLKPILLRRQSAFTYLEWAEVEQVARISKVNIQK